MSSYEFDAEALEEIEYWKERAREFETALENREIEIENLQQENYELQDLLSNMVALNSIQASLDEIDKNVKISKEYLETRGIK